MCTHLKSENYIHSKNEGRHFINGILRRWRHLTGHMPFSICFFITDLQQHTACKNIGNNLFMACSFWQRIPFRLAIMFCSRKKTEVALKMLQHTDDSRAIDKLLWLHLISIRRKCSRTGWRRILQRPQPTVVKLFKLHYVQYFTTANNLQVWKATFERMKSWWLKILTWFFVRKFHWPRGCTLSHQESIEIQWIVKQLNLLYESYHCLLAFSRMKTKILFVISVYVFASGIALSVICYFVVFFVIVIHISLNVIAL